MHPLTEEGSELGDQISVISSEKQKKGGGLTHQLSDTSRLASVGWHSDITFENVTSDYAMLKIHTLPKTGGDTVSTHSRVRGKKQSANKGAIALGVRIRSLRSAVTIFRRLSGNPDGDT